MVVVVFVRFLVLLVLVFDIEALLPVSLTRPALGGPDVAAAAALAFVVSLKPVLIEPGRGGATVIALPLGRSDAVL